MIHNRDLQLNDSSQAATKCSCISSKPPPIREPNGQQRDATWGGAFDMSEFVADGIEICGNLTSTTNPVILSLATGGRPFYEYSKHIANTETANAINFVVTVRESCQIAITTEYCNDRFGEIYELCPTWHDKMGKNWTLGGKIIDTCAEFYVVAGTQLTGDLWVAPLADMNSSLWV
jgi:hypothetical protein